ncbi:MAG: 5-formyltetrahydrofolate cyclo-ligase [Pyrinomonadaceae bacterium]
MFKIELRKIYLAEQKSLSKTERIEKSRQIAKKFFANFDLRQVNFLHCFLPIEKFNEIDTKPIFQKVGRDFSHITTLAPRINFQTGEIESAVFITATALVKNVWQIDEPTHNKLVETELIDLVLVPLLCFDTRGFRVGYGKGFYDKFLSKCRRNCLKIGLSYFAPATEISDIDEFDIKLDFCITPKKIFSFFAETRAK